MTPGSLIVFWVWNKTDANRHVQFAYWGWVKHLALRACSQEQTEPSGHLLEQTIRVKAHTAQTAARCLGQKAGADDAEPKDFQCLKLLCNGVGDGDIGGEPVPLLQKRYKTRWPIISTP